MKTCAQCKQVKAFFNFSQRKDTGKYTSHCRDCRNAKGREQYKDPELFKEFDKYLAEAALKQIKVG